MSLTPIKQISVKKCHRSGSFSSLVFWATHSSLDFCSHASDKIVTAVMYILVYSLKLPYTSYHEISLLSFTSLISFPSLPHFSLSEHSFPLISEDTGELSRQIWYQPNFCCSKKLFKPPESKTDCAWGAGCRFRIGAPPPSWTLAPRRVWGLLPCIPYIGQQVWCENIKKYCSL